jgi:hypothetical protein
MTAPPATRTGEPSGSLVIPAILIALGVSFLLANFGLIAPLSLRSVLALWPLVLVLVGIHLLVGRERPSFALGLQLGVLAIGLALVLARAYIAPFDASNDTRGASPAIAGAPEIVVTAQDIHFSPTELHLPSGSVNLTLRNDGVLPHDLTIPALGVHVAAGSGQSVTTGLRDLPKGRYSGYCGVSGHADAGMRLEITVD